MPPRSPPRRNSPCTGRLQPWARAHHTTPQARPTLEVTDAHRSSTRLSSTTESSSRSGLETRPRGPTPEPSVPPLPLSRVRTRTPHQENLLIGGQPQRGLWPVGDHFNIRGKGRYFNPANTNGNQFNKPAVKGALQGAVRAHTRSQYFRRSGFGAAMRYTLGMEQVPSHVQDYLNARTNPRNQTGIHPGPWTGYNMPHQSDHYGIRSEVEDLA